MSEPRRRHPVLGRPQWSRTGQSRGDPADVSTGRLARGVTARPAHPQHHVSCERPGRHDGRRRLRRTIGRRVIPWVDRRRTGSSPVEERTRAAASASTRGCVRIGAVGAGRSADDPARVGRCARTPTASCARGRARRPTDRRHDAAGRLDRAGDDACRSPRRRPRPTAAAAGPPPPTASTERRRGRSGRRRRRAEPACAGTYTVIANDYWNRFPKSSGASVRGVARRQQRHARHAAVRRRRALHPGGRHGAGPPPPADHRAAGDRPPPPTTSATAADARTRDDRRTGPTRRHRRRRPRHHRRPSTATPAPAPADPAIAASVEALIREIWPDDLEERALDDRLAREQLRPDVHNGAATACSQIYFDMGTSCLADDGHHVRRSSCSTPARTSPPRTRCTSAAGWGPWAQTDPG